MTLPLSTASLHDRILKEGLVIEVEGRWPSTEQQKKIGVGSDMVEFLYHLLIFIKRGPIVTQNSL